MTRIELTTPCCLQLGLARADGGALCELGLTLQHPPIQLAARPAARLSVAGPRADVAAAEAARLNLTGEIEIEIAIPANMGLGSDGMMQASVVRGLTPKGLTDPSGLSAHAFTNGGLLCVDEQGVLSQCAEIAHANEDDDWVFVLVFPKEPDDLPETYEADQHVKLIKAASHLPAGSELVTALFEAVAQDDFAAFAGALTTLHAANEAALAASGKPVELNDQARDILDFMRANGAAMAARALTGLGLYGLIKGGPASRALRTALTRHLGYFGPLVMASICDNHGAKIITTP